MLSNGERGRHRERERGKERAKEYQRNSENPRNREREKERKRQTGRDRANKIIIVEKDKCERRELVCGSPRTGKNTQKMRV